MSMTVAEALAAARRAGVERLDAQLLLARALQRDRSWLLAHGDAELAAEPSQRFDADLRRRAAGEPLAYLLGEKAFHALALQVDARVLVPRPETELLVDWALERLRDMPGACAPAVVDLGTGSGAIALAVKHAHAAARMTATDASPDALALARDNAARLGLDVEFVAGSWWAPLAGRHFALALSNPPYVAAGDHHLAALHAEPALALSPGPSGLEALAAIVADAPQHLAPGGWLLLEHGYDQADAVRRLLIDAGFAAVRTRADLAGQPRCSGGHL